MQEPKPLHPDDLVPMTIYLPASAHSAIRRIAAARSMPPRTAVELAVLAGIRQALTPRPEPEPPAEPKQRRGYRRLTDEDRGIIRARTLNGDTAVDIARSLGCSDSIVQHVRRQQREAAAAVEAMLEPETITEEQPA